MNETNEIKELNETGTEAETSPEILSTDLKKPKKGGKMDVLLNLLIGVICGVLTLAAAYFIAFAPQQQKINTLTAANETLQKEITDEKQALDVLNKDYDAQQKKYDQAMKEVTDKKKEIEKINTQITTANAKLSHANEKLTVASTLEPLFTKYDQQCDALASLMNQFNEADMNGDVSKAYELFPKVENKTNEANKTYEKITEILKKYRKMN